MFDPSSWPTADEIGTGVQNLIIILGMIGAAGAAVRHWWRSRKERHPKVASDQFAATKPPTQSAEVVALRAEMKTEVTRIREEHGGQLGQLFTELNEVRVMNDALGRRTHALEHAWPDGHRKPWIDQRDAILIRDFLDEDTIEATAGRSRFAPPDKE